MPITIEVPADSDVCLTPLQLVWADGRQAIAPPVWVPEGSYPVRVIEKNPSHRKDGGEWWGINISSEAGGDPVWVGAYADEVRAMGVAKRLKIVERADAAPAPVAAPSFLDAIRFDPAMPERRPVPVAPAPERPKSPNTPGKPLPKDPWWIQLGKFLKIVK